MAAASFGDQQAPPTSCSAANNHHNNNPPNSSQRADESDLDPAAFLKTVRELSEKREREDAERYRKLEEEIARGRQERAARRAERARSISPQKSDAAPRTPVSSAIMDDTPSKTATDDIPEFRGFGSQSRKPASQSTVATPDASASASTPSRTASSLARSGTLSWQQRPSSRGGSRSHSPVKQEGSTTASSASQADPEPSRDQITASLASRDPAWFRQTADRGAGNAAYRRSKDEVASGEGFGSGRQGLPGMSRETSTEPAKESSPVPSESLASDITSRTGSTRESNVSSSRFSATRTSTSSKPDLKSLVAADEAQEKASPMSDQTSSTADGEQHASSRNMAMSSPQARIANSTERPSSPTKGMGGFVQSAMMRRSDSANKRWTTQPAGSGLSRDNSLTNGSAGLTGSYSMPKLEPTPGSMEPVAEAASREVSSSSNLTKHTTPQARDDTFVKPDIPRHHSRSKSVASSYSTTADEGYTSPPSSPTKRWSPSKSSWLESSISKPESPKPASAARNSQPSWMADIAKAKAQRASTDSTPKPAEDEGSRPSSPTKFNFGQGMLRRSESKDLSTPASGTSTPKLVGHQRSRSASPTKSQFGQSSLARSESKDFGSTSGSPMPSRLSKSPSLSGNTASVPPKQVEPAPSRPEDDVQPESVPPVQESTPSEKPEPRKLPDPPTAPKPSTSITSPTPSTTTKQKPDTPPKPSTDFRGNLRTRPPSQNKQDDAPEFLSKFGNLRKTQTQNYVAPDVLKDNILRGKSDLTKTGGPVKTQRRDELKESLLAKKEQWKKDKEDGVVHERKGSNPPQAPQKPEALAKRETMGRSQSTKAPQDAEKTREATPEALARHKSLKVKPQTEPTTSMTSDATSKQPTETSMLASRFNPGLAGMLARGPPQSDTPPRSGSPAQAPAMTAPSEPPAEGSQLQDVRKGRAKGPKRRKGGAKDSEASEPETQTRKESPPAEPSTAPAEPAEDAIEAPKAKPQALPGSAASVMMASLKKSPSPDEQQAEPERSSTPSTRPPTLGWGSPSVSNAKPLGWDSPSTSNTKPGAERSSSPAKSDVPDFKGFGSNRPSSQAMRREDNKENAGQDSPSVKSAASMWGKQSPGKRADPPGQIQLPSKKDEEAAMRSAGLLASSPSRPSSRAGLGISADENARTPTPSKEVPPKPGKSSRTVSGQLQEASPNKDSHDRPLSATERRLTDIFGTVPHAAGPLSIDAHALITNKPHQDRVFKTVKKSVLAVSQDGALLHLPPQEEYTYFDECVYLFQHAYTIADGPKKTENFLWAGNSSSEAAVEHAQSTAKKLAKEGPVHTTRQGAEPPGFLQALGGILVTRRGARENASKQYMLCGRKHLGQIVFDEVEFGVQSLCAGFAYLISYPATSQDTKLYLWKGSACSAEEISAARLAAMDLSETGEIIEVDGGAEFASFLKIFGPGTTKSNIPAPTQTWQRKALAPNQFTCRLYRIQEVKQPGKFTNFFTRRPSWNRLSPARSKPAAAAAEESIKLDAKELTPFTQADLEGDGIYLLDAPDNTLYVILGPLFPDSAPSRDVLFAQTLFLASEYAVVVASAEDRAAVPKTRLLLGGGGVPGEFQWFFRHWDQSVGLWGTGTGTGKDGEILGVEEVLEVVCS